jgi:hypothetical protein
LGPDDIQVGVGYSWSSRALGGYIVSAMFNSTTRGVLMQFSNDIRIEALGFSTCGQCPWSLVDHLSSLGTNKILVNKTLASK